MKSRITPNNLWRAAAWLAVLLYLALTLSQLDLPGLHYDEAKEAGINALEILQRQKVLAFRSSGVQVGTLFLPLMVQDYIGALNVYLALPFLALFGVSVTSLRLLAVACGLATLILAGKLAGEMSHHECRMSHHAAPITMLLLAASPSFIFWSRQGIFVTNVSVTLAVATVWTGLRWWRRGRPRDLYWTAALAGLGLWAKLLFVWVLGALAGIAALLWLAGRIWGRDGRQEAARRGWQHGLVAAGLFILALSPLLLFNQQTGGTLDSIFGNLGSSYYGVQNSAFLDNLAVRLGQVATLLRGDHFWYLGGPFANRLAPWLAAAVVAAGLVISLLRRRWLFPLATLFVLLLILQSCFTVSDLFVTHFAIIQPFVLILVALGMRNAECGMQNAECRMRNAECGMRNAECGMQNAGRRVGAVLIVLLLGAWLALDVQTDWRYQRALAQTGGHASHSDATTRLAGWLDGQDAAQPLALDWGFEAPVRFLTANRVQPLELFGYERLDEPDGAFAGRLAPFLADRDRLYLLHTAEDTVFQGRREALERLAAERGLQVNEAAVFSERSGRPVALVLRVAARQAVRE